MINNYINHICYVLDASGSMRGLENQVVKVFDDQVKHLARRSKELNQETRVSVYLFSNNVQCLLYDMDVMRLPSISDLYKTSGNTALIDGTLTAITDLNITPQRYGDHSFLIIVQTDGEENYSKNTPLLLSKTINTLPDNWTVSVLVPNQNGCHEAKKFGFPANNISIWSNTSKGLEDSGEFIRSATDSYMVGRSKGIRSTKSLFKLDVNVSPVEVKRNLQELSPAEYQLLPVHKDSPIKEYVESWKIPFVQGSCYYQLTKPETIQPYKQLVLQNKANGKLFSGQNARKLLNLPDYEVKVSPGDFNDFFVFAQSTSTNRKLLRGTNLVIIK